MQLKPGLLDWDEIAAFIRRVDDDPYQVTNYDEVDASRRYLENRAATDTIYGVNTGFGKLASRRIDVADVDALQEHLVLSHAVGVGAPLPQETVRLMILLKANSLAQGCSGVRPIIIQQLLKFIEHDVSPRIPSLGSVGASGDLAPLAHMTMPLIGHGELWDGVSYVPAKSVLADKGLTTLELKGKEGLALLNGVQASNAIALIAYERLERLFEKALLAGGMSTDALQGSDVPFDKLIHKARKHPGQILVASKLRYYMKGSGIRDSHIHCQRVQDPYCLRCQPQVMGACYDQMMYVKEMLVREANAVSDNPLIFAEENKILSGGNFHGEVVAMACDNLALAIAEIGNISERRTSLLLDAEFAGLPLFLAENAGVNSGFMMAQVTAASLVSENKCLASPRSVDSIPTSANQEDHVSMSTNAALRLGTMLNNLEYILAIEFLAAAQAIDFRRPLKSSEPIERQHAEIRKIVPHYGDDRYFSPDIEAIRTLITLR